MDQWYYSVSNEQKGPATEAELRNLLEKGSLPPACPVWKEGMTDWLPATSIPDLQPSPYASPAMSPAEDINWSGYAPEGPQIRPWVRYWARTLDIYLFSTICGLILGMVVPSLTEISDALLGMIFVALFCVFEPLLLSVFGTTPFKALLNIRVRKTDGSKPTYMQALDRSFRVFFFGQGMAIPLVLLFTYINSYQRLTNDGITKWDSKLGFTVSHRKVAWWRCLILAFSIAGFAYLLYLGSTEV